VAEVGEKVKKEGVRENKNPLTFNMHPFTQLVAIVTIATSSNERHSKAYFKF
jgi:hypothetical protein